MLVTQETGANGTCSRNVSSSQRDGRGHREIEGGIHESGGKKTEKPAKKQPSGEGEGEGKVNGAEKDRGQCRAEPTHAFSRFCFCFDMSVAEPSQSRRDEGGDEEKPASQQERKNKRGRYRRQGRQQKRGGKKVQQTGHWHTSTTQEITRTYTRAYGCAKKKKTRAGDRRRRTQNGSKEKTTSEGQSYGARRGLEKHG